MTTALFAFWLVVGYLIGSLPAAYFVGKVKGVDIRALGSRSAGATNLARQLGGWRYGAIAILGDTTKCIILMLLVRWASDSSWLRIWVVGAMMLGSIYPVFLGFKGGKGVAVLAAGSISILSWAMFYLLGVWVVLMLATRKMSLTNMATVFVGMIIMVFLFPDHSLAYKTFGIFAFAAISFSHRENIGRLLKGKEPDVAFKF